MPRRILIFAPATLWAVHHQLDCVIGRALQARGHEVKALRCDGLLKGCFVLGRPPDEKLCEKCQEVGDDWFGRFGLDTVQMASLLSGEVRAEISRWAESLDMSQFAESSFRGLPVCRWMMWTMHGFLRTSTLDFADPEVCATARRFAEHSAMIAVAVQAMLESFKPDQVICFSGSNGYYRTALEVCKMAGLPVLVHERGYTADSFVLYDSVSSHGRYLLDEATWYEGWRHVPLTGAQWQTIATEFKRREQGESSSFQQALRKFRDPGTIRSRLRLPSDAKIVLVLTTGDWEFGMAKAFGGIGIVWDSQIEWCRRTAELCAKHGWHMVVRHHPLGAGTKTYPRGTAFIADLLEVRSSWHDHVRMIMPGENVSTYDLIAASDACVVQFTTGGAEACLRGVPTLCVGASGYRHVGMTWVKREEDYEGALSQAMKQGAPMGEGPLRHAFRFLYYLFYTTGTTSFTSVGMKNHYEPDFRLASPDDLKPGADPALDRLCAHLEGEAPLHPMPQSAPPAAEEDALVAEHRAALLAERALAATGDPGGHPSVAVMRVCEEFGRSDNPMPADWRSRHKECEFHWLTLHAGGGIESISKTLRAQLEFTSAPYVCILPPRFALDEAVLATAVDGLEAAPEKAGMLFGLYVMLPDGKPGTEWNTLSKPIELQNLPDDVSAILSEPLTTLGLVIWRKSALLEWVFSLGLQNRDLGTRMLRSCVESGDFIVNPVPLLYIDERTSPAKEMEAAEALAAGDKLDEALNAASALLRRCGHVDGLRTRMAGWLHKAGRHSQALALLRAEYDAGSAKEDSWQLLQKALSHLAAKPATYKDCHSAVDTVEGYMVPGQEKYLHDKVLTLPHTAKILEVGACYGRSTAALGYACVGTRRSVQSIDTFFGNDGIMGRTAYRLHVWQENMRRLGLDHYVVPLAGYSHPLLRAFPEEEMFDFVFIDASHEYADVLLDFELAYPRVKPGGWIGFHDVEPGWPGCWRVWEQTGKKLLINHEVCETLACGQKQADVPWNNYEDTWPGFRVAYAQSILTKPEVADVAQALIDIEKISADDPARSSVEQRIANAPVAIRNVLLWGVTKERDTDPWIHYSVGLSQKSTSPEVSARHFTEAAALGVKLAPSS